MADEKPKNDEAEVVTDDVDNVTNAKEAASIAVDGYIALQNDLIRYVRTVAQENNLRFNGKIDSAYGELQLAFTGASRLYTRIKEVVEFADSSKVRYHLRRHMRAVHEKHKMLMETLAEVAVLRTTSDDDNVEQVEMLASVLKSVMDTMTFADKKLKLHSKAEAKKMGRKRARAAAEAWNTVEAGIVDSKGEVLH